jgi:hypothetical protein
MLDDAQPAMATETGAQQQLQLLGDLVCTDEVMGEAKVSTKARTRAPALLVPHAEPTPTTDKRYDAYSDQCLDWLVNFDGSGPELECSARYTEEYHADHSLMGGAGGGPSVNSSSAPAQLLPSPSLHSGDSSSTASGGAPSALPGVRATDDDRDLFWSLATAAERERYLSMLVEDSFTGPKQDRAKWETDAYQSRCLCEYMQREAQEVKRRFDLRQTQASGFGGTPAPQKKKSRKQRRPFRDRILSCSQHAKKSSTTRSQKSRFMAKAKEAFGKSGSELLAAFEKLMKAYTAGTLGGGAAVAVPRVRTLFDGHPALFDEFEQLMAKRAWESSRYQRVK